MKINLKQRLRSLPFWTAVASLLGLLLQQASLSSGAGFDSAFYNALTGSVFSILLVNGFCLLLLAGFWLILTARKTRRTLE